MDKVSYGFVDNQNVVQDIAIFVKDDFETIERVKNEYGAVACYPIDESIFYPEVLRSIWTGSYFTSGKPNDGNEYTWSEELMKWVAVVTEEVPE